MELIKTNIDKLENVAKALLDKEQISGEEFEIVYNGGTLPEDIELPDVETNDSVLPEIQNDDNSLSEE